MRRTVHLVRLVLFDPGTLQIFLKEFEKTG